MKWNGYRLAISGLSVVFPINQKGWGLNLSRCISDHSSRSEIALKLCRSGSKVVGKCWGGRRFPEQSGSSQTDLKGRKAFEMSIFWLFSTLILLDLKVKDYSCNTCHFSCTVVALVTPIQLYRSYLCLLFLPKFNLIDSCH